MFYGTTNYNLFAKTTEPPTTTTVVTATTEYDPYAYTMPVIQGNHEEWAQGVIGELDSSDKTRRQSQVANMLEFFTSEQDKPLDVASRKE